MKQFDRRKRLGRELLDQTKQRFWIRLNVGTVAVGARKHLSSRAEGLRTLNAKGRPMQPFAVLASLMTRRIT